MANVAVGELGISVDGRDFLLRPSFLAISRLGTPEEIVYDFRHICSCFEIEMGKRDPVAVIQPLQGFDTAKAIITACLVAETDRERREQADFLCGDVDYDDLDNELPLLVREGGKLPADDIIKIAFSMLRFGIAGKPNSNLWKRGNSNAPMNEFDPSELVGIAVSQFNMHPDAAWNLTMVEYQRAWEGKFPEAKEQPAPLTEDEAKEFMSWAKGQVEKAKTHGVRKR